MRVTIDLPDGLLHEARALARERGTTLEALIEMALRRLVEAEQPPAASFRLRKRPFGGEGLAPELRDAEWGEFRRLAYGERDG